MAQTPPSAEDLIGGGPPSANGVGDTPAYIGVPDDYMAFRPPNERDVLTPSGRRVRSGPEVGQFRSPTYVSGDEWRLFGSLPVEDVAAFQQQLAQSGVLTSKYRLGVFDDATRNAAKDVLGHANATGSNWIDALQDLASRPKVDPDDLTGGGDLPEPYVAPDFATMAQNIKGWFRQTLDRDPEDWELTLLADEMDKQYSGAYDWERQAAREVAQYEQAATTGGGEPGEPPSLREVDPKARFQEELERRYSPEIDAERREADASTNAQLLLRSITGMDRAVGA